MNRNSLRAAFVLVLALVAAMALMAFTGKDQVEKPFDPQDAVYRVQVVDKNGNKAGSGSAVYLGNDTFITANHVARVYQDGGKVTVDGVPGTVKVLWQAENYDIAMFKLKMWPAKPGAELACEPMKIGDNVHAIGYALGEFVAFHSFGKIGALKAEWANGEDAYLTDAALIWGMSGGGLFNDDGKLVGIIVGGRLVPIGAGATITGINVLVPSSTVCGLLAR